MEDDDKPETTETPTMVHVGVSRWREEWIIRQSRNNTNKTNQRVAGVWDPRLVRETIYLRDGRRLTYFLDGPPDQDRHELPHIFVFHAMFLSGNVFLLPEPPTDYVLVCVNRPGYFGSDAPPQPKPHQQGNRRRSNCLRRWFGRQASSFGKDHDETSLEEEEGDRNPDSTAAAASSSPYAYQDFAKDMEELANHLRVAQFAVAGHSSGGPCALVCASHLTSRRVTAVGLLSSDPEYAHPSAPNKRWINAIGVGTLLPFLLDYCLCCLPLARNTSAGLRNDYRLETSLYCFDTERIPQPVTIYVGEDDAVLPPDISRHMHERLTHSTLHIVPKVGHLSLLGRQDVLNDFYETILSSTSATVQDKQDEEEEGPVELAVVSQQQQVEEDGITATDHSLV